MEKAGRLAPAAAEKLQQARMRRAGSEKEKRQQERRKSITREKMGLFGDPSSDIRPGTYKARNGVTLAAHATSYLVHRT